MIKVLGVNGSPRRIGNTAMMFEVVFDELNKQGIQTEILQLADYDIKGCSACKVCNSKRNKLCANTKDGFNPCFLKMIDADGIILGSPVYSAGITSQMKAFIDRAAMVLSANRGLLKYKAGSAITPARRGGAIAAFNTMIDFLHSKEMILIGSTYWNMAYGNDIGDIMQDNEGIENMKNLGQNMAWLLKKIKE